MINCDIFRSDSRQRVGTKIYHVSYETGILEFLSFKLNILCSVLFHIKFVRLTTKYTLPAYTEYYVCYTIWIRKLESKNLPFGILFYLLNWRPHISVKFVLSFRHIVAQFVKLTTCKLLIVQAHRNVCLFHTCTKNISPWCVALLYLAILFEEEEPRSRFSDKIFWWW